MAHNFYLKWERKLSNGKVSYTINVFGFFSAYVDSEGYHISSESVDYFWGVEDKKTSLDTKLVLVQNKLISLMDRISRSILRADVEE